MTYIRSNSKISDYIVLQYLLNLSIILNNFRKKPLLFPTWKYLISFLIILLKKQFFFKIVKLLIKKSLAFFFTKTKLIITKSREKLKN